MERQDVFLIIIIIVIAFLYITSKYETYVSGSYDITPAITVGMDWKGSQVSGYSNYPNNLINPSEDVDIQMRKLQSYNPNQDGITSSDYVSANMQNNKLITDLNDSYNSNNQNNSDSLEGFTMMNPYIPQ
jgi:hypothetical protein